MTHVPGDDHAAQLVDDDGVCVRACVCMCVRVRAVCEGVCVRVRVCARSG